VATSLANLGGDDQLSAGERQLVQRAALSGAIAADAEACWVAGQPVELGDYYYFAAFVEYRLARGEHVVVLVSYRLKSMGDCRLRSNGRLPGPAQRPSQMVQPLASAIDRCAYTAKPQCERRTTLIDLTRSILFRLDRQNVPQRRKTASR
jgi:hypothetical protein